jgi:Leucine-rich repeat (LRR) protein
VKVLFLWVSLTQAENFCDEDSKSIQKTLKVIQEKLGQTDCLLTMNVLHETNSLNLSLSGISDIRPLRAAKKLRVLLLGENEITDLSPISDLSLRWLDISKNPISDLSPLSSMHSLETIWASYMKVSKIDALREMKNLQYISLEHNEIKDISPLNTIKTLEFLGVAQNEIEDFEVLGTHTSLRFLSLKGNPVVRCPEKRAWSNICQKERKE